MSDELFTAICLFLLAASPVLSITAYYMGRTGWSFSWTLSDKVKSILPKKEESGYDKYAEGTEERNAFHAGFTLGLKITRGIVNGLGYQPCRSYSLEEADALMVIHDEGLEAGLSCGHKYVSFS